MRIILIFLFLQFGIIQSNAQCLDFAKTVGFEKLDRSLYISSSRVNALTMGEGDQLDIYIPFFRGKNYRVVIVNEPNVPKPSYKITNLKQETVFDSSDSTNIENENLQQEDFSIWEYTAKQSENLVITLSIPEAPIGEDIKNGCVAIVIGFKKKSKKTVK